MASHHRLAIADDLTIYHALELKQRLSGAIDKHQVVDLDLSLVGEIDTAGLQLLIFARQEASRASKKLNIVAHSQAVREAIEFCNLGASLGDPGHQAVEAVTA
jgi:anti-sigma B factor antagonist